jgi:hypothetical protein
MWVMNRVAAAAPGTMRAMRPAALLGLALALAACSSSAATPASPLTCPAYQSCGGNVVGTWRFVDSCSWIDSGFGSADPDEPCAVISRQGTVTNGTWTFNADGTYAIEGTLIERLSIDSPLSCKSAGGGGGSFDPDPVDGGTTSPPAPLTCKDLERLPPFHGFTSVTCTAHADRCACINVAMPSSHSARGVYTTKGSALMVDGNGPSEYCVRGDDLFLHARPDPQDASGSASSHLMRVR